MESWTSMIWTFGAVLLLLFAHSDGQGQIHLALLASEPDASRQPLPKWIVRHAGPIAPFHQIGAYEPPPQGCRIVQVNRLQRHGSRYPTAKVNKRIQRALQKIRHATHLHESLSFITNYQYHLSQDSLLPLGALESFKSGVQFASRYQKLMNPEQLPFMRASSSQRVVDSAKNFTAGLASWLGIKINNIEPLVISEDPQSNNTLDNNSCPNRESRDEKHQWLEIFGKQVTERLNLLATDAHLNNQDTLALMQLCIFDSLADRKLSRFCGIFENLDWAGYGYYYDLEKYYDHGLGNRLGQAEGIGYVAELIARLTGDRKWVKHDESKVNQTLDQSSTTFPLDQSGYVDFSHDNQMIGILAALGLQVHEPLPGTGPPPSDKIWDVSKWMPFSSRLTTEKMICGHQNKQFVRFVLNDVILIPPCKTSDKHLMLEQSPFICPLDQFIESRRGLLIRAKNLHEQCFREEPQ
ncbi:hypothetical protein, variant [Puccinia triticina 1-1 BBBD Race 1]|uniref:Phytase A n=2 Tax=Puccinia triticina TaxID=208348 RepID=A0A180GVE0_PUCT1|nr:uncharacterized protein PtA15_18A254 [Puccinia triticina]OAV96730.1 hypothetical protein, variant [Puccinia triticina 1-1 BBBD Race 1]WAQ93196.1 hypothetical protein PtA15_18A254 [Puccinia triticina]WAR63169.1 hypothetical protein PtB15_18B251 [Puccinia triticina]